jgi:LmbE family N-acetylglucosaminyl deacetylase
MNALVMVAHPDDCIIFARGFVEHYKEFNWTMCYLTYTDTDARAVEIAQYWNRRGINTKFLGYTDTYKDLESGTISFDTTAAAESIKSVIKDYELILTHDHHGDYGHLHHKFVCKVVHDNHKQVITFALGGPGNAVFTAGPLSLDEIPLHREVVAGFSRDNYYCITDRVKQIL